MRLVLGLFVLLTVLGCSDDDKSPTSPGDDLVGTWIGISTTDPDSEDFAGTMMVLEGNGKFTVSQNFEGIGISVSGTWEIVGGKFVAVLTIGDESESISEAYTLRGNRLTFVDDEDGVVEIWERQ